MDFHLGTFLWEALAYLRKTTPNYTSKVEESHLLDVSPAENIWST